MWCVALDRRVCLALCVDSEQFGEAVDGERHERPHWNELTGRLAESDLGDAGMLSELAPDRGEVGAVVVADVQRLDPNPFTLDGHGEAASLQSGLRGQRFSVVQKAVAIVADTDEQDVPVKGVQ